MLAASLWLPPLLAGAATFVVTTLFGGDWKLATIAALTLGAAVAVARLFGLKVALGVLAVGALVFADRRGVRRGQDLQKAKEKTDADRRATERERTVENVHAAPDDELRRRARRWVQPDR